MSDPITVPDDADTSLRSVRAVYTRRARDMEAAAEREIAVLTTERNRLKTENENLRAELGHHVSSEIHLKVVEERDRLKSELERARSAILNQCGDNLCRFDDWPSATAEAKALPEAEFLESYRRYRNQIAGEVGEYADGLTIAQLEVALEQARQELASTSKKLAAAEADVWCDVCCGKGDPGTGVPCMCGGTGRAQDAVNYLRPELFKAQAVAEAFKALAASEGYVPGEECPQLEVVMTAVLALGPEFDWREKYEPRS